MKRVIEPGPLRGTVRAIPSKSDALRKLILSALAGSPTLLAMDARSEDIDAAIRCLTALGAKIKPDQSSVLVEPIARGENTADGRTWRSGERVLDCAESASLLRFLMPLIAALGMEARFITRGKLAGRPHDALIAALRAHGVRVNTDAPTMSMSGQLTAGVFELPGDVSSQFASGLLMALPLLESPSEIVFTSSIQSQGYIDLTLEVMRRFGLEARRTAQGYHVPAPQLVNSPSRLQVEGDWSNAAFFLAANALGGDVRVSGLDTDSAQADRDIVRLVQLYTGGNCATLDGQSHADTRDENHTHQPWVSPQNTIIIDVSDIPDLVPILAVIATQAPRQTRIVGAARLRFKESDRLSAMYECLRGLGAQVRQTPDALIIEGGNRLRGGEVSGYNDHRIVMAMAMAATVASAPVTIHGSDAVTKSYPGFYEDFAGLGGRVHG